MLRTAASLAPGGGLQSTGGDVADAYFRAGRQDELVEIAQYAVALGLVPMLMTHGLTLLENPISWNALWSREVCDRSPSTSILTQAGRRSFPIENVRREADLHPVRQAFTDLALRLRAKTGLPLELAHNCTVTERNLEFVPEVVRWFLADTQRTRIWRILSFQPEAKTGRTIFSKHPATPAAVWEKICEGIGRALDPSAFIGGHPDCKQGASLLICQRTNDVLPLIPPDATTRALFAEILEKFGAISTVTTDGDTDAGSLVHHRIAGSCARNPSLAVRIFLKLISLLVRRTLPFKFVRAIALGRAHTINIGTHNFMDAGRVANAPNDPVTSTVSRPVFSRARSRIAQPMSGKPSDVRNEPKPLERAL